MRNRNATLPDVSTPIPRYAIDVERFRAEFARRGARNDAEIADMLGVNRSTISRVLRGQQRVGPTLHSQMIHVLGARTVSTMFRIVNAA